MIGKLEYPHPIRVQCDENLPKKIEVAVIGGGIIGITTAFALAEQGVPVAVFEKGEIGAEQSCRNWGFCRTAGRDFREIPLAINSLKRWEHLQALCENDLGFKRAGIVHGFDTEQQQEKHETWLKRAKHYGVTSRLIGQKELANFIPLEAAERQKGALYTPDDAMAEPILAAPHIALAAKKLGVLIYTNCAVRGFEKSAGKISAIVTEKGVVECQNVVIAGGAWSSLLCSNLGLRFPQLAIRSSAMHVMPQGGQVEVNPSFYNYNHFSLRKRMDGSFLVARGTLAKADITTDSFRFFKDFLPLLKIEYKDIRLGFGKRFFELFGKRGKQILDRPSIFEAIRILNPKPMENLNKEAYQNLPKLFSGFENAKIIRQWAGYIDATPDTVPVISKIDEQEGLFMASGFSGHGFGIGPGAGYLMADIIMGKKTEIDQTPYRFSRMNDGSKHEPQCGV